MLTDSPGPEGWREEGREGLQTREGWRRGIFPLLLDRGMGNNSHMLILHPWPRLRPSNPEDGAVAGDTWWRLCWEGRRGVLLCVSAWNLLWIPFAFFNKIQNHKLCKARKLKGQTLSGVHFKSEVQSTFNDIIAKGKNLFERKTSLWTRNEFSDSGTMSLSVPAAWGGGGGEVGRNQDFSYRVGAFFPIVEVTWFFLWICNK